MINKYCVYCRFFRECEMFQHFFDIPCLAVNGISLKVAQSFVDQIAKLAGFDYGKVVCIEELI